MDNYAYLTSLRGIAAILVALYHIKSHLFIYVSPFMYRIIQESYLAVDFFFILSGFILTMVYKNKFAQFTKTEYLLFLSKRFARIYPLHLTTLILSLFIPLAYLLTYRVIEEGRYSMEFFIYNLFLVDNWGFGSQLTWNIPSWSISTEAFAYLCFPFLLVVFARLRFVSLIILFLLLHMAIILVFNAVGAETLGQNITKIGLYRCLFEFSLGMVLYLIFTYKAIKQNKLSLVAIFSLIIVGLALNGLPNFYYIPMLFSLSIFILATTRGIVHKILCNRALLYLGEISYSIYMLHYLVRDFMQMLLLENEEIAGLGWILGYLSITFILAALSYRIIEFRYRIIINDAFSKYFKIHM
jgi:peptidoglycan/LPS O-acetylase OafA/YrhL